MNAANDVNNCGGGGAMNLGCGKVCSNQNGTPSCSGGNCSIVCNGGFANCDGVVNTGNGVPGNNGCEINTGTDLNNCGSCNNKCNNGSTVADMCVGGSCKCGNGAACGAGQRCSGGMCVCDAVSCAGCCTAVRMNLQGVGRRQLRNRGRHLRHLQYQSERRRWPAMRRRRLQVRRDQLLDGVLHRREQRKLQGQLGRRVRHRWRRVLCLQYQPERRGWPALQRRRVRLRCRQLRHGLLHGRDNGSCNNGNGTCGNGGALCVNCAGTIDGDKCVNQACGCGGPGDCPGVPNPRWCDKNGTKKCLVAGCDNGGNKCNGGCCDESNANPNNWVCAGGTDVAACGTMGAVCAQCANMQTCPAGVCL